MRTFKSYLVEEAAPTNKDIYRALLATGKVAANQGRGIRVSNPNKISAADFIKLIKDTFDGVTDVVQHDPETGPNNSRTWPLFVFSWNGKVDCGVWLTGEIKGRGSKQTTEQEVSWLLILAAMYYNMSIINASTDTKEHAVVNEMLDKNVYQRVYGANGKALNKADALGLIKWLTKDGNEKWFEGHLSQCKKFVDLETNAPVRFVKDRSTIPIVARAKEVFNDSVPDQKFDKDKWNPADVWLEYEDFTPTNYENLDQLNKYLKTSIQLGNGIIGVSLKQGSNAPKGVNLQGFIPNYIVENLFLQYGELLAQNVNTEYVGNELAGYSVMYRLFSAKPTETIRGEADKKGSLAMHGKVFLEYLDFLAGSKKIASVEAVKGILVKQNNKKEYEFTTDGITAFKKVKTRWKILQSSDIFQYNSRGKSDINDYTNLFHKRTPNKEFLDYLTQTGKDKRISEISMQTRVSARFQTIVLGSILAKLKALNLDKFKKVVLGMLLYGKSESQWSAPHYKVE